MFQLDGFCHEPSVVPIHDTVSLREAGQNEITATTATKKDIHAILANDKKKKKWAYEIDLGLSGRISGHPN